ncbi:MAG: 2-dehydropantoate 2-reductase [Thermomicrobiales bacterium]
MRVVIVGPGALGSLLAATFHRHGHEVALLGRVGSGHEPSSIRMLRIERTDGALEQLPMSIDRDPSVVSSADLVIMLVKSGDTSAAAAAITPWVSSGQPILTLQNGLGNAERIRKEVGPHPIILRGVTSLAATRLAPGHVRHTGSGPTLIGYSSATESTLAQEIVALFTSSGLPAAAVADIDGWIWRKLAINAAINGLTALAGVPNGTIASDAAMLDAAEIIAEEVAAVARANGWEIGNTREMVAETARATAANRSSMLQDLDFGRPTEVDAIHGAVITAAASAGIAVPATTIVTSLIRMRERTVTARKGTHDRFE